MADSKLSALDAVAAASTDDLLYLVDAPGSSPVSKKITFDNLQKSITAIGVLTTSVEVPVDAYVYIGPNGSDGSWRMAISGGALSFQKRVSGSWVEKGQVF